MKSYILLILMLLSISIYGQIPNTLTPAQKIYGLSKFWQEVNYNFIYINKIDRNEWDKKYLELIETIPVTKNDYEYFRELQKFCALLKDGHTNVYFPKVIKESIKSMNSMFGEYRLFIQNIENKPIIIRTNLSKKDEIPVGSEIIEVNGETAQDYISRYVSPYISSSTEYVLKDVSIERILDGLECSEFNIKVRKPNGEVLPLMLTHKRVEKKEVYPETDNTVNLLDLKYFDNQIAYLALNSFSDSKIDTLFIEKLPELYKAKGLIIDLRKNGGGNTSFGTAILQYFTNDTVIYGSKSRSRLHIPSFKAWGKFVQPLDTLNDEKAKKYLLSFNDSYYEPFKNRQQAITLKNKRIVIPTVILIGHNTASAAEDFLIYADNQKHIIKIGENTFGSTGQPFMFDMVGGGSARICTKQDVYPDGREFVGYGIKPDIEVIRTLDDYLKKKDPALSKALDYLITKIK